MKLLSKQLGRVVLLKPVQELAPLGGVFLPSLYDAVRRRYAFNSAPEITSVEGAKFSIGRIIKSGREYPIQELIAFTDGLVCSADDTEVAEFFLDDLLIYLCDHFVFRPLEGVPRKLFLSQVWVQFEKSADGLISRMDAIANVIGGAESATYGTDGIDGANANVQLHSVAFDYDKTRISSLFGNLSSFRIERKIGAPFSENVLFSVAPLRTTDHISVLEQIERIAGA